MRFVAAIWLLVAWLGVTPHAFAHASLVASEPAEGSVVAAAPDNLVLTFNEPVNLLALRLVMPDGKTHSLAPTHVMESAIMAAAPEQLGNGTYLLSWRVVSLDGHPIGGTITFSIGEAGPSPQTAMMRAKGLEFAIWFNRTLLYGLVFFGTGGIFFRSWLAREPLPQGSDAIITACLALVAPAAALALGLLGLDALDQSWRALAGAEIWKAALSTSFGLTVGLLIAAALIGLAARFIVPRMLSGLALITAALAFAASGHAAAANPQWLTRPAIFIHAVSVALWLGSLPPLLALVDKRLESRRASLAEFSAVMPWPLGAVVLTGVVLALVQIAEIDQIWTTPYGRILCLKLLLVTLLLGLAAYNRFALTPRALAGDAKAERKLSRTIAVEIAIAIAILASVALWRFTPPPRTMAAAPAAELHFHGREAMALIAAEPDSTGDTSLVIDLLDMKAKPLAADEVRVTLSQGGAIEPIRRDAIISADGKWRAGPFHLPGGKWHLRLDIRIGEFKAIRIEGELPAARE